VKQFRVVSKPLAVTCQIEGGIMMGVGYALVEGLLFDEGDLLSHPAGDQKQKQRRNGSGKNFDSVVIELGSWGGNSNGGVRMKCALPEPQLESS
jgi:hypothetical protein